MTGTEQNHDTNKIKKQGNKPQTSPHAVLPPHRNAKTRKDLKLPTILRKTKKHSATEPKPDSKVAEKITNPEKESHGYRAISKQMGRKGDLGAAREFLRKALRIARKIKNARDRAEEQSDIAVEVAEVKGDSCQAFKEARQSAKNIHNPYDRAGTQRNVASKMSKAAQHTEDAKISSMLKIGSKDAFEESRASALLIKEPLKRATMIKSINSSMKSCGFKAPSSTAKKTSRVLEKSKSQKRRQEAVKRAQIARQAADRKMASAAIAQAKVKNYSGARSAAANISDPDLRAKILDRIHKEEERAGQKKSLK